MWTEHTRFHDDPSAPLSLARLTLSHTFRVINVRYSSGDLVHTLNAEEPYFGRGFNSVDGIIF